MLVSAELGRERRASLKASIKFIISLMYKVPLWQIKGAPDWLDTACYDIEAKADRPRSIDDLHLMEDYILDHVEKPAGN